MSYRDQLQAIYDSFTALKGAVSGVETDSSGRLTSASAKDMHEALGKQAGLNGFEIVEDWNRRSPEDDQW